MGNRANSHVDMAMARARRENPDLLLMPGVVLSDFFSLDGSIVAVAVTYPHREKKTCPDCGAERGSAHTLSNWTPGKGCRGTLRGVRAAA